MRPDALQPLAQRSSIELIIRKRAKLPFPEWISELDNFVTEEGATVDFRETLTHHASMVSPFCVDDARKRMIFVRTPLAVDLQSSGPFYYQEQRRHATALFAVPYRQLPALVELLPDRTDTCIFVHSTGRCGSTLLSQLLGTTSQMQSVSEPDVYTQIALLNSSTGGARRAELIELLSCTTRLLLYHLRSRRPTRPYVALKLRSLCVHIADMLHHASPAAKSIFLYRNALGVIESYCLAFFDSWKMRLLRAIGAESWFLSRKSRRQLIESLVPLVKDPRFQHADRHDPIGLITLLWLSSMDSALRLQDERFFACVLRYEELVQQRLALVKRLLERCGIAAEVQPVIEHIFKKDAQMGSRIASKHQHYLRPADERRIRDLIALHERIREPGFILPGTLS
jgi:sulfotransferase family protein